MSIIFSIDGYRAQIEQDNSVIVWPVCADSIGKIVPRIGTGELIWHVIGFPTSYHTSLSGAIQAVIDAHQAETLPTC